MLFAIGQSVTFHHRTFGPTRAVVVVVSGSPDGDSGYSVQVADERGRCYWIEPHKLTPAR